MNRIETKVQSARRRIILGRFGHALCVTLFAALIVATLAIALPALRFMEIDFNTWVYSWIGGCSLAALVAAGAYAIVTAPSVETVATEVDRRFGLRERLSSSLTLDAEEQDTAFGLALQADADKRAGQLEVAGPFSAQADEAWLVTCFDHPCVGDRAHVGGTDERIER